MPKSGPSLVDVIMPAHNAAITIEASIKSALASPRCRRVLVIDDASSDQTPALVESLAARADGRIELIRLPTNSGPARARNIGLSYVEADLVAFLDADDHYEREALTAAVGALDGMPDLAVVRMALKPVGLDRAYLARPDFEAAWTLVTFTVQSNVVMRRQVLIDAGGFPEDELFRRRGGEDVALMQAITRTCRIGTLFKEPGVFYRIRPGCGALKLLRSAFYGELPPGIEADLAEADAVTQKIMERLTRTSSFARPDPSVVEVLLTWAS